MANNAEGTNNISEKFQNRIKQIIEDQDCNRKDFPNFVGVSRDVIIRATKYGIIPSLKSLIKIANKLNVSIPYLLGETDNIEFLFIRTPYYLSYQVKAVSKRTGRKVLCDFK